MASIAMLDAEGHCSDCGKCNKEVYDGLACERCDNWYHTNCVGLGLLDKSKNFLANENIFWFCDGCLETSKEAIKGTLRKKRSTLDTRPTLLLDLGLTKIKDELKLGLGKENLNVGLGLINNDRPTVPENKHCSPDKKIKIGLPKPNKPTEVKVLGNPIEVRISSGPIRPVKEKTRVTSDWKLVGPKSGIKKPQKVCVNDICELTLENRFQVLRENASDSLEDFNKGYEYTVLGDSIIANQDINFCSKGNKLRNRICLPGAGIERINSVIKELPENKGSLIVHVGTNELTKKSNRYDKLIINRNSVEIEKRYEILIKSLAKRQSQSYVVGILPRINSNGELTSRMLSINSKVNSLCDDYGILFIDLWDHFSNRIKLFKDDGLHLNEAGSRKYGNLINDSVKSFPLGFW